MDTLIKAGEQAPQFQLPDLKGKLHSLDGLRGWIIVLNFWSAECTWCERVDHELTEFLEAWKEHTQVLWIASNANESRDLIERVAAERNMPAVLLDPLQIVANLYGAQTTPHFFVVDAKGILAYQGAWDDVTFRQRVASQVYIPQVVEALSHNLSAELTNTPPYGCMLVRFAE
jgi:peroxiredoxin